MINKNQFEKSIIFLKDNTSKFIFKAYKEFVTCLDELSVLYTNTAEKGSPYSVNKSCKHLFATDAFMEAYLKAIPTNIALLKLSDVCRNVQIDNHELPIANNIDEFFYTTTSADIYAPVIRITASVFPHNNTTNYMNEAAYIKFEIDANDMISPQMTKDPSFGASFLGGMNGDNTMLDRLTSNCFIDLTYVFDLFFRLLSQFVIPPKDNSDKPEESIVQIEKLNLIVSKAREVELSERVVNDVTNGIIPSVIATYLVFASKLHGTKNDIYSWAYTAFVKDSVSTIDKTYYPTHAPVTLSSGHGIKGSGTDVERNKLEDPLMDQISTELNGFDDADLRDSTKKLIYRSIRLQYSTWATIMSAILSTSDNGKIKDYTKEERTTLISGTTYDEILAFVRLVLKVYLSARYRTYNTSLQMDLGANPYQSAKAGNKVVSVIKDETAVSYLKDISEVLANKAIGPLFVKTNSLWTTILKADKVSTQLLSKLFLETSYLLMLDKIHAKSGTYLNDIDNSTGKTKLSLYEEVYYGVVNKISNITSSLNNLYGASGADSSIGDIIDHNFAHIITDVTSLFTPFTHSNDINELMSENNDFVTVLSSFAIDYPDSLKRYIDNIKANPDKYDKNYLTSIVGNIINIPITSDFNKLTNYTLSKITITQSMYENQDGSMFPKNKVVLDSINAMNAKDRYLFKSLESVDNSIEELSNMLDLSSEGADGMANNGCYNALAAIGSGVASMEIHSEDPDPSKLVVDDDIPNTTVDAENNITRPDSTSPEDQAYLTSSESVHINAEKATEKQLIDSIDNKYGFLFNKYVLGMK